MDDLETRTNDLRYSYLKAAEPRIYRILPKALSVAGGVLGITAIAHGTVKDAKEAIFAGILGIVSSAYAFYKHRQLDRHIDEQKPL